MRRVRSSSPSLLDSVDEGRTRQGERDQAARVAAADLVARDDAHPVRDGGGEELPLVDVELVATAQAPAQA